MIPLPKPILYFIGLTTLLALPLLAVVVIAYSPVIITPNGEFFTVSIDGTPQIDANTWHLSVEGLVDHPLTLSYQTITAMPNVTETAKLECVDGPSGIAIWAGVPLNTILAEAGVQAGAVSVVFYGADGYSTSLALPKENTSDVLLAWEMNGVPLPPDHGFPVRIVAPNELGYKWAKWVVSIELVNYDYQGYWESRGWSNNAEMAPPTDWRLHAALFSIAFLLGGLAAVSGIKMRPESTAFRDFPAFMSRRFHVVTSLLFLASVILTFVYWTIATFALKSALFYTFHGIVGLICASVITAGALGGFTRIRRRGGEKSWHGKVSLLGYGLLLLTILLGFALTAGNSIIQ